MDGWHRQAGRIPFKGRGALTTSLIYAWLNLHAVLWPRVAVSSLPTKLVWHPGELAFSKEQSRGCAATPMSSQPSYSPTNPT